MKKAKPASAKKPREKPLSLYGFSFEEVVKRVATSKPLSKTKKRA